MKALRRSFLPVVTLLGTCLVVSGCGGSSDSPSGPSGSAPAAQPTPVPQANIIVNIDNPAWGPSLVGGFNFAFAFDIRIRETNGVSANLQVLRADFFSGGNGTGSRLERQQVPGRQLTNLPANGTLTDNLVARFNAGNAHSVVITVRFNDARGNLLETTHTFNCCSPYAPGGLARIAKSS
jgi:hypothetical protein